MINKIIEEIKEIKTLLKEIKNNQDKIIKFQEVKNSTTIGSTTQKNKTQTFEVKLL